MKDIDLQIGTDYEGDIGTTIGRVDDDGNTLYNKYGKQLKDILLTEDSDWLKQVIFNRLTTQNPDWYHHPSIGANLEDLIGQPNTKATAEIGVASIKKSLTYDGLVDPNRLSIRAVPVDANNIVFFIRIINPDEETYYLTFNYTEGIEEVGTV